MFVKSFRYLLISGLSIATTTVMAQRDTTLNREVEVVKAYQPTISDANKISSMPKIEDEQPEKPVFNYSIFSQPVYQTFSVNTLKAATLASEPGEESGLGWVRAGVGNYNRPYGELFFNSQKIKNTLFGIHGKHLSSHSDLKLEGGDIVDAPFSDNRAEIFIKNLTRNSVLSVNLGIDHNGFNYYGYPVDPIPLFLREKDQTLTYQGQRQTFTKGYFGIGLEDVRSKTSDLTFDFDFDYHYFGTKTEQREHYGSFITEIVKPYPEGTGTLEAGIAVVRTDEVFNRFKMAVGPAGQTWFTAKPSYKMGGDIANLQLGVNAWLVIDNSTDMVAKLAPVIRGNFYPADELIRIFAGIDGNYINNHYSKIAYENPFVDPKHHVRNSFEAFHLFGGFDGKLSAGTNFKISADYSVMKDHPVYYLFKYTHANEGTDYRVVENDFKTTYENLDLLKFNAEIFHAGMSRMQLMISGNYYVYKLKQMEEAWNMPDWDAKFSLGYRATDQLNFSADILLTGRRQGLILSVPGNDPRIPEPLTNRELLLLEDLQWEGYNLPTIIDLNVSANYRLTNQFSLFAQMNNFGFSKYQQWLGYPVQRFNFLGGLSYSF